MNEFNDKVAVITGAASGIGRAVAERCAQEGMKVVLAGINESTLTQAEKELKASGAKVLSVRTDVSKAGDIEVLAQKILDAFGGVHLLFNNAGVYSALLNSWESTLADWQWVMGVNLWGVIHGLRTFVPIMLAQECECHIVNNASLAGLTSYHPSPPYQVTKHAVVALSENLCFSLAAMKAKVKASVLCTGWVKTRIMDADRNRPPELQNEPGVGLMKPANLDLIKDAYQAVEAAMPPQEVAGYVFQAIRNEQFYILTHPEANSEIQTRMENILNQRNPA